MRWCSSVMRRGLGGLVTVVAALALAAGVVVPAAASASPGPAGTLSASATGKPGENAPVRVHPANYADPTGESCGSSLTSYSELGGLFLAGSEGAVFGIGFLAVAIASC